MITASCQVVKQATRQQIAKPSVCQSDGLIRDQIDHTSIVRGKMTAEGLMVQYTVSTPGTDTATVEVDARTYYEGLKLKAELFIKRARIIEAEHERQGGAA